jgi:serine/threonine-protein kinase
MAMASRPAPPLAQVAPEVPPDVTLIVDLALAFSKTARYPDARTMQADVRAVRAGQRPEYAVGRFAAREQKTALNMTLPPGSAPPASLGAPGSAGTPRTFVAPAPPPGLAPVVASQPPKKKSALVPLLVVVGMLSFLGAVAALALWWLRGDPVSVAGEAAAVSAVQAGPVPSATHPRDGDAVSPATPQPADGSARPGRPFVPRTPATRSSGGVPSPNPSAATSTTPGASALPPTSNAAATASAAPSAGSDASAPGTALGFAAAAAAPAAAASSAPSAAPFVPNPGAKRRRRKLLSEGL